jgi:hypothetical protein
VNNSIGHSALSQENLSKTNKNFTSLTKKLDNYKVLPLKTILKLWLAHFSLKSKEDLKKHTDFALSNKTNLFNYLALNLASVL